MTRSEIRQELVNRGFDGFDPEQLNRYIDWGIFYLARKLRVTGVEDQFTFTLPAGTYYLNLASQVPVIKSVRRLVATLPGTQVEIPPLNDTEFWKTWSPLGYSEAGQVLTAPTGAAPTGYFVVGGNLIITPVLDKSMDYTVETWRAVKGLEDEGEAYALPEEYEEVLLFSCMRVCHIRANELDRAMAIAAQMDEMLRDQLNEDAFVMDELQEAVLPNDGWGFG